MLSSSFQNVVDDKGRSLYECVNTLSYGKFNKPIFGLLRQYLGWMTHYKRMTGKDFDVSLVDKNIQKKIIDIKKAKSEISIIKQKLCNLSSESEHILVEIDWIIECSSMNEYTSIHTNFDKRILEDLFKNISKSLPKEMVSNEIEQINSNLSIIAEELSKEKPRNKLVKAAIDSLKSVKGTIEFGAAVSTLIQFIQSIL